MKHSCNHRSEVEMRASIIAGYKQAEALMETLRFTIESLGDRVTEDIVDELAQAEVAFDKIKKAYNELFNYAMPT